MQILISWLLQKPTDLDLHCLLRQSMSCSAREELTVSAFSEEGEWCVNLYFEGVEKKGRERGVYNTESKDSGSG